jgi:hypothetical protein
LGEEAAPAIVGSITPNIAEAHLTQTDRRQINTPVLAIGPGRPSGREAEPPSDREAEPPSDREAERPSDREAEPPSDREVEPLSDREAERPSDREVEPLSDLAVEALPPGQRLAHRAQTKWAIGRFPGVQVPVVIGMPSAALLAARIGAQLKPAIVGVPAAWAVAVAVVAVAVVAAGVAGGNQ